jgi:hypothetical protein
MIITLNQERSAYARFDAELLLAVLLAGVDTEVSHSSWPRRPEGQGDDGPGTAKRSR